MVSHKTHICDTVSARIMTLLSRTASRKRDELKTRCFQSHKRRLMVVLEASVYPKGVLLLCARAGSAIPVRGSVISLF